MFLCAHRSHKDYHWLFQWTKLKTNLFSPPLAFDSCKAMVLHWFKIPLEVQYTITSYKALLGMQHVVSLTLIFQKSIVLLSVRLLHRSRYLMLCCQFAHGEKLLIPSKSVRLPPKVGGFCLLHLYMLPIVLQVCKFIFPNKTVAGESKKFINCWLLP